jgi:hypothetical protein
MTLFPFIVVVLILLCLVYWAVSLIPLPGAPPFLWRRLPRPSMGWVFRPTRSLVGNLLSIVDEVVR